MSATTVETPTAAVTDWIEARLAAFGGDLTGINVRVAVAEQDQPRPRRDVHAPYITLRHLGSNDRWFIGARRGYTNVVIEATAWEEDTDLTRIRPIVRDLHVALHRQRGVSGDVRIVSCIRVAPVERQIIEDGQLFTQLGGEYRIRATRS